MRGSFFQYFGGKWRIARQYPAPCYDTIVEPFAGSAGYSCRYPDRNVVLVEKNPTVAGVWKYLIRVSPAEILALPDVPEGATIYDLNVIPEARALIGFWLDSAVVGPCPRPCKRMRTSLRPVETRFWGPAVRRRLANQVGLIKHWLILNCGYEDLPQTTQPGTWFVDPPYNNRAGNCYKHGASGIDFTHLGNWCKVRNGQVIVCENMGAGWLPFRRLTTAIASRRLGQVNRGRSEEGIWTNEAFA